MRIDVRDEIGGQLLPQRHILCTTRSRPIFGSVLLNVIQVLEQLPLFLNSDLYQSLYKNFEVSSSDRFVAFIHLMY